VVIPALSFDKLNSLAEISMRKACAVNRAAYRNRAQSARDTYRSRRLTT
jgi:hypothetical protein